jgi:precorrin-2 dehydrogenase/sirohydrochlorin ferrochelatase
MERHGASSAYLFPAMLRLEGRKCLVVGAGLIAAGKVAGLLSHHARVVVVSPRAFKSIRDLARAVKVIWHRRKFSPKDVEGALLVVAATDSSLVNEAVFRACSARGILCNVVDDPKHCHFFYPAVVRRGPLEIAISTNGRSPALASRLRRELQQQFGPEWGAWVEQIGRIRGELLGEKMSSEARRRRLLRMVSPQAFRSFLQERKASSARTRTAKRPRHR